MISTIIGQSLYSLFWVNYLRDIYLLGSIAYFEENKLLSPHQFGLRANQSTIDALLCFEKEIINATNANEDVCV